jgi:site-specific recombinase XerD
MGREDIRWQRAAQAAPARDRALAAVMRLAGARIAETVGLDLADPPSTRRRRGLRIRGNGRKDRTVLVHPDLAAALDDWLVQRRS